MKDKIEKIKTLISELQITDPVERFDYPIGTAILTLRYTRYSHSN